ncbi:unnamed protein product [Schistosoma margrebowiei]|uniref:Uncharacterized protein n=1 Tax=Schistosoma margrebowiei TaxID=48269 RepID=A0A183N0J4_9TREM|nr:unnamed protein product [Schistosoma margrebowiei]
MQFGNFHNFFEFNMLFGCRNATLALPILAFTASDPPCSSTMPPWYVKNSTYSKVSPSSVIGSIDVLRVVFEDPDFSFVYVEAY